jgi:hypothetical protein
MANNEIIEVRQIYEMGDFPADVQKAAEGFRGPSSALRPVSPEADDDMWHSRAPWCRQKTVCQFRASG